MLNQTFPYYSVFLMEGLAIEQVAEAWHLYERLSIWASLAPSSN